VPFFDNRARIQIIIKQKNKTARAFNREDRLLGELFLYLRRAGLAGDIGDDAAVIAPKTADSEAAGGGRMAVSVDSYSEGVHFNSLVPDDSIGYRSVTGAVSDIAAMGSAAESVLISMGLPRKVSDEKFFALYGGIKKACKKWRLKVEGGDIVASRSLYISVCAIGPAGYNIRRSGAKKGDILFITSYPGLSSAGLDLLKSGESVKNFLVKNFLYPDIFSGGGEKLFPFVSALMDSSDGLIDSCRSIARQSGVAVNIESALVPLKKELVDFCLGRKKALRMALVGGEDYYLVGASAREKFAKIKVPVFRVGTVSEGEGVFLDGNRTDYKGFRHFS